MPKKNQPITDGNELLENLIGDAHAEIAAGPADDSEYEAPPFTEADRLAINTPPPPKVAPTPKRSISDGANPLSREVMPDGQTIRVNY